MWEEVDRSDACRLCVLDSLHMAAVTRRFSFQAHKFFVMLFYPARARVPIIHMQQQAYIELKIERVVY